MKKILFIFLFLLFIIIPTKAATESSCVSGLNVTGKTYRVNGHQNMWLPNGSFSYKGSLPPASCFNISDSSVVSVRVSGSSFQFQPHTFGNASITVSVSSDCLCPGISSLSKTVYFKLSEWGLKSLSVKGHSISPKFYNGTMDYTLKVPYDVDEIEVLAEANWPSSTIKGTGKHKLNVGTNKIVINVTTVQNDSRDYTITVTRDKPLAPTSVKINEKDLVINVSDTKKLSYTITPESADKTNLKWESSNPDVVAINDGEITAKAPGTASIVLKLNNLTDKINVTVIEKVYDIEIESTLELEKNSEKQLEYKIKPENALNKELLFESNNLQLFTVDTNGLIKTYNNSGEGILTITSKESNFKKSVKIIVKSKLDKLYFDNQTLELKVNETKKLFLNISPRDSEVDIIWTSTNPNVATVNNAGIVTAINDGVTTINATDKETNISASIAINVTKEEVVPPKEENKEDNSLILIILIIIVILIIIYLLFSIKKNKSK